MRFVNLCLASGPMVRSPARLRGHHLPHDLPVREAIQPDTKRLNRIQDFFWNSI